MAPLSRVSNIRKWKMLAHRKKTFGSEVMINNVTHSFLNRYHPSPSQRPSSAPPLIKNYPTLAKRRGGLRFESALRRSDACGASFQNGVNGV